MNEKKFLGLDFIPISLEQQTHLEDFLRSHPQRLNGFTFASLVSWGQVYSFSGAFIEENCLILSIYIEKYKQRHLLQPIGNFSEKAQKTLLNAIEESEYPIKIYLVSKEFLDDKHEFCSRFNIVNDRNKANYLYRTHDLSNLAGRHYDGKRNLISQGEKTYNWTMHPLTEKCKPHCPKILEDIGSKPEAEHSEELSKELKNELKALDFMLVHFSKLNQKGNVISIDGKPAAFSMYEELNPNTAVIHFEKAERKYKGLYQLINRETAKLIEKEGYEYINREEDLGIEGLRKAKTSYHPVELIPSHTLTFKRT